MVIGLVPMGGFAQRWSPYPCPKELLPFGVTSDGRLRLIGDYVFDCLIAANVELVVVPIRAEKASLVLGHFGSRLANGAPIVYMAAPGPSLLANLKASVPLLSGHTVLFGMPDTYFEPRDAFQRCLEQLEAPCELVLGAFVHSQPEELDLVRRNGAQLTAVLPKPRPNREDGHEAWGLAVWGPAFTDRLRAWSMDQGATEGHLFHQAALSGRARCVCFLEGSYIDLASYLQYRDALDRLKVTP